MCGLCVPDSSLPAALKTLLWAMPERAQHIGIMVALGVDEVQWVRITNELPEIIPRGAQGWERYY